jgi:hypothetical protein
VQENKTLSRLDIGDCELGTQAMVELVYTLRYNSSLTSISLENPRLFSLQVCTFVPQRAHVLLLVL